MDTFFSDIRLTLVPGADSRYGPLPTLLVLMTVVTGIVDSFSFLKLGHVFVANSTGNILFMGFALLHVKGVSVTESLLALAAMLYGAAYHRLLQGHLVITPEFIDLVARMVSEGAKRGAAVTPR